MRINQCAGMTVMLWLVCGWLSQAWAGAEAINPVRLTTHELVPYSHFSETGRLIGSAVEVIDCAFARMKLAYTVDVVPWKRAQQMVIQGQADGFFAASRNQERNTYAVMSAVVAEQNWVWYLPVGSEMDPNDPTFKRDAMVSSFLGANMQDYLKTNGYRTVSFPPPTSRNLLSILLLGRLDAALANDQVMNRLLYEQGAVEKVRRVFLSSKPLGVYYAKAFLAQRPSFLDQFNQAVEVCRKGDRRPQG